MAIIEYEISRMLRLHCAELVPAYPGAPHFLPVYDQDSGMPTGYLAALVRMGDNAAIMQIADSWDDTHIILQLEACLKILHDMDKGRKADLAELEKLASL
jgi:hypothetical protein